MKYRNLEERLLARTVVIPEGELHAGCWMWMGHVEENGYAKISLYTNGKNKSVWVHRAAYECFSGEKIPPEHHVDHTCRFQLCINPAHHECVPGIVNAHHRVAKYRNNYSGRFGYRPEHNENSF